MSYLLRKYTINRWIIKDPFSEDTRFPADPLWDLRTTDNKLSVYFIDDKESNLDKVILALASAPDKKSRDDILAYVLLDPKELKKMKFVIEESKGKTRIQKANESHRNIVGLTAERLIELAKIIYQKTKDESSMGLRNKQTIRTMVIDALNKGLFSSKDIAPIKEMFKIT